MEIFTLGVDRSDGFFLLLLYWSVFPNQPHSFQAMKDWFKSRNDDDDDADAPTRRVPAFRRKSPALSAAEGHRQVAVGGFTGECWFAQKTLSWRVWFKLDIAVTGIGVVGLILNVASALIWHDVKFSAEQIFRKPLHRWSGDRPVRRSVYGRIFLIQFIRNIGNAGRYFLEGSPKDIICQMLGVFTSSR